MNGDELSRLCTDGKRLIGVLIQSRPQVEPFVAHALAKGGVPHFLFAEMYEWKVFERHRNCCVICFDCVPQETRPYFIQRRNIKQEAERSKHNRILSDFRNDAAAKNILNAGFTRHREGEMKLEFIDRLAMSNIEAAVETMNLYEVEYTPRRCACLTQAAEEFVTRQCQNLIQTLGFLNSDTQALVSRLTTRSYPIMLHVKVIIEEARVADVKRRREMKKAETAPASGPTYHTQYVTQGDNSVATQTGDVTVNQYTINDYKQLTVELEELRTVLKAQPSTVETDETIGLLASAEKAATKNDESGVKAALGKITKGGWEIVKSVAPTVTSQIILAYLKAHGLAL